jgi:hypothetical protein
VLNSGAAGAQPPETQFDYANPQRYFDRMRQLQQQYGGVGPASAYPGSTLDAAPAGSPTATPTAPTTLGRPGIAPTPAQPPQQQQFFNPYNLPPDQLQGNPAANPTATPVEPDRSKYANPYVPTPSSTSRPPE